VWKRLTTTLDRDPVIDRNRGLNEADLKTGLAERVRTQLMSA
jgi:hypothetical protein